MNAVVLDGYTLNPGDLSWEDLIACFDSCTIYDRTTTDDLIDRAQDADVLFTNKVKLSQEDIHKLPRLKAIFVMATGYNVVDVKSAKLRDIPVYNVPAYSSAEVAQHVLAFILHVTNGIALQNRAVHKGAWGKAVDFTPHIFSVRSLQNITLGLYGYGSIAQEVVLRALAFGMRIIVYNRSEINDNRVEQVDRETLCARSDFLSIHIPQTQDNIASINHSWFNDMKKTAWLINTARGGLIDEQELLQAVTHGHIAGALLDVLTEEPMTQIHPFLGIDNIIMTPHVGWAADQARARCMATLVQNAKSFLKGDFTNCVNRVY